MNTVDFAFNVFNACLYYVYNIANTFPADASFVSIINTNNVITIQNWNCSLAPTPPTISQLQSYTVDQVSGMYDLWQQYLIVNNYTTYSTATSLTVGFTGPWTGTQNVSVSYQQTNSLVQLSFPDFTASGNGTGTASIVSTVPVPFFATPSSNKNAYMIVVDNGNNALGLVKVNSSGIITIGKDLSGTPFTSVLSGNFGWVNSSISYRLS